MKISSNVVGDYYDENDFPHKLLLTNTQVSKLNKAFKSGSSANIKLSKTELNKIRQSGRFSGRFLGPLLKTDLPLIGNVCKPLVKSVLMPLGLKAAAAATHAAIHKEMFESGMTTLIISNKDMNDIMEIVKSLEESDLLIRGISETLKNKAKEQKGRFLSMLLGALGASLLENLLTGKGVMRAGEGTIRAGQNV